MTTKKINLIRVTYGEIYPDNDISFKHKKFVLKEKGKQIGSWKHIKTIFDELDAYNDISKKYDFNQIQIIN